MTKKSRDAKLPNLDVSVLLDRTGSMASNWTETIMAVNAYCQKMLNDQEIDCRIMVTVFDRNGVNAEIDVIRPWQVEGSWRDIQPTECPPRGNTPLYEAIGVTLTKLREDWRATKDRHGYDHRVQFVVMTDGEENASSVEWPHTRVFEMVKECDRLPGWSVIFLGANIDAVKVGMSMGTQLRNTMTYTKENTWSTVSSLAQNSRQFGLTGQSAFSDADRAASVKKKV